MLLNTLQFTGRPRSREQSQPRCQQCEVQKPCVVLSHRPDPVPMCRTNNLCLPSLKTKNLFTPLPCPAANSFLHSFIAEQLQCQPALSPLKPLQSHTGAPTPPRPRWCMARSGSPVAGSVARLPLASRIPRSLAVLLHLSPPLSPQPGSFSPP